MASLERVVLTSESVFATVAHALSTERQEVMGLLFGRWDGAAVEVESVMPLPRLDKRSDRVEVTGPQLAEAAQVAESLGLRVAGWYHSHPHITVQASHVDVRTQAQYQALDGRFFGLICACFQGADGAGAAAPLRGLGRRASASGVPVRRRRARVPGAFARPLAAPAAAPPAYAAVVAGGGAPPSYDDVARAPRRRPRPPAPRRGAPPQWRARDIPIAARGGGPRSLRRALETLAALQDALFREEADARRAQAGLGGGATRGAYADAIFHKAAALLAADALHPLIHVAAASKANLAARLDAAKAARSKLLARLEDDSAG
ncbi:metallopeptidase [Aureococcus anophagefferens]|uniref:Metallopeptidase n=1 Tax=Aureococcus anophagefferens TaxID=44056 RepID=A0ABR1FL02_AURAN